VEISFVDWEVPLDPGIRTKYLFLEGKSVDFLVDFQLNLWRNVLDLQMDFREVVALEILDLVLVENWKIRLVRSRGNGELKVHSQVIW
jgi:hypothetical protein